MICRSALAALLVVLVSRLAAAQPPVVKSKPAPRLDFVPVDSWFSYSSLANQGVLPRLLPDISSTNTMDVVFGGMAEEIIIVGERQRRDFMLIRPSDELTGPRALDAAQPVVPLPGATCTYKTLCYDMSQPPLRATLPRLAAFLFGD